MNKMMVQLNSAQKEAVSYNEGPMLVIAGAGSGKTRVLTAKVAKLISEGMEPGQILCLTFTNKAAKEMRIRIAELIGEKQALMIWMGTFHSMFARILRVEAEYLGLSSNFTIYDTDDARSLLRDIIKDLNLNKEVYKDRKVYSRISMAKNNLVLPAAYEANERLLEVDKKSRMPGLYRVYKEYVARCQQANALDFDDLLLRTNILFYEYPEVLKKYQTKFSYLLVDEYQDTNHSQYLIVNSLAAKHHKVCVVGDDSQSIYSFRGARMDNIFTFRNDFPTHKLFKLEQNYRSTRTIVKAANSIIEKNKKRIEKEVFSHNEKGEAIKLITALSDVEEAALMVSELQEDHLRNHTNYDEHAFLYRMNVQSRLLEEALRHHNIPYRIVGGLSFYQRKEIKDVLAYLRLTANPHDNESLKRIINYPIRGIGATTVAKLSELATTNQASLWQVLTQLQAMPKASPFNKGTLQKLEAFRQMIASFREKAEANNVHVLIKHILTNTGILTDLYKDKAVEGRVRYEHVQELISSAQVAVESAQEEGEYLQLDNYLQEVSLFTDMDNDELKSEARVTLMTVHSAKGLEFDYVYVVGMEERVFPSNFVQDLTLEKLEEERRLFYVAVTRAKRKCCLSAANQRTLHGKTHHNPISRFVGDIDAHLINTQSSIQFTAGNRDTKNVGNEDRLSKPFFEKKESLSPTKREQPFEQRLSRLQDVQERKTSQEKKSFLVGDMVVHQRFGKGEVIEIEGEGTGKKVIVSFHHFGQKRLLVNYVNMEKL